MMRLFLIEKHGGRKIELGLFKFNDEANCINAAKRKHRFLEKLESNDFEFRGEFEPRPLKREKMEKIIYQQMAIE